METFTHDAIVNSVIVLVSEESGMPAQLDSLLLDDMGLDSLDFVNIAQQLESQFNIGEIPDSDLFRLQTVGQIVKYIESYINHQAEVAAARLSAEAEA